MNVFYEESGSFKVGSIVSRNDASLQVDTQHGKRAKLKAANVFLEFSSALQDFLPAAEAIAAGAHVDRGEGVDGFEGGHRYFWWIERPRDAHRYVVADVTHDRFGELDIENFEYFALKGANRILTSNKPIIYAELWNNENRSKCFEYLKTFSYSIFVGENNQIVPLDSSKHHTQNFIFIAE